MQLAEAREIPGENSRNLHLVVDGVEIDNSSPDGELSPLAGHFLAEAAGQQVTALDPGHALELGTFLLDELSKNVDEQSIDEHSASDRDGKVSHLLVGHLAMRNLGVEEIVGRLGEQAEPAEVVSILTGLAKKINAAQTNGLMPRSQALINAVRARMASADDTAVGVPDSVPEKEQYAHESALEELGELLVAEIEMREALEEDELSEAEARAMRDVHDPLGAWLRRIGAYTVLSEKKQKELAGSMHEKPDAKKQLIETNLRLVVTVAKRYLPSGMDLLDLIQEGNIGLINAVEKYVPNDEYSFSGFAWRGIRNHIVKAVRDQGLTIRLPARLVELRRQMRTEEALLIQKLGRAPKPQELAKAMNVSAKKIADVRRADSLQPTSLDAPAGLHDDRQLADTIEDVSAGNPGRDLELEEFRAVWEEVLQDGFNEKEQKMLRLHMGLVDGRKWGVSEIAEFFGQAHQTISPQLKKAKFKLTHPSRARKFKSFLTS